MELKDFGFTKEELQERVVEKLVEKLRFQLITDENGEEDFVKTPLWKALNKLVDERIHNKINEVAETHLLPRIDDLINEMTFQQTNKWGEPLNNREPETLKELIVRYAEEYIKEPVNHIGKTKKEDSFNFRATGSRMSYAIDKHLQFSIESAMQRILEAGNVQLAEGIKTAVEIKLNDILKNIKVKC